jgi:formylglycine-generating enzyme required for sulfatase activity
VDPGGSCLFSLDSVEPHRVTSNDLFVIQGLKGKADEESGNRDGKVTLGELASYTSTEVYKFVDRNRNDEQLPEYLFKANSINLVDLGGKQSRSFTNSLGMKFTLIKADEFLMGSPDTDKDAEDDEKPQHRVRITRPFYLGVHEVTRGQFRRFVDDSGYQTEAEKDGKGGNGWNEEAKNFEQNPRYTLLNPGFDQTDEHPVVNVSWNDAVAFAEWLGKKEGKAYRLPTEAEWEYACRAGTTTRYFCGDDVEALAEVGNVADGTAREKYPSWNANAARDGFVYTAPDGRYRSNAWGLHDMHGNVLEWCWDWYGKDFYKGSRVDDPAGPLEAAVRVIRGGGWDYSPRNCRSANRDRFTPDLRSFRLALVQQFLEAEPTPPGGSGGSLAYVEKSKRLLITGPFPVGSSHRPRALPREQRLTGCRTRREALRASRPLCGGRAR